MAVHDNGRVPVHFRRKIFCTQSSSKFIPLRPIRDESELVQQIMTQTDDVIENERTLY